MGWLFPAEYHTYDGFLVHELFIPGGINMPPKDSSSMSW
jgi:hypothetical protein